MVGDFLEGLHKPVRLAISSTIEVVSSQLLLSALEFCWSYNWQFVAMGLLMMIQFLLEWANGCRRRRFLLFAHSTTFLLGSHLRELTSYIVVPESSQINF
jgi:hypothetical protein